MYDERCCIKTCCFDIVITIVAAVITMALGIIIGAYFAETLITVIPALALFAISMFILLVVLLILRRCRRERGEGCFER